MSSSDETRRSAPKGSGVLFRGISKRYGDVCAVANLNLAVAKGEFLTLLGPSGSGKTTTLMMLAGFQDPTSGDITLDGKSLHNVPAQKRNIGMVFQNYALFPHMTVGENIAFPLSVRGMSRREMQEPIARVLDLVRLTGLADRRPSQLSGGQQQRVALARALVFNPPLILMDEPLGALDRQLREKLQIEIKHIHAELGVTLVYVTHDQSEALTMSDRVAVFNDGRLCQIGSPAQIYEQPENAFVAQFVGESNQLEGKIVSRDKRYCCVELDSGFRLNAVDATSGQLGNTAVVINRPERLLLREGHTPSHESAPGVVVEVIYHGDYVLVRLRADSLGARVITGKVPNSGAVRVEPGAKVSVAWCRDDWRAFDPSKPGHLTGKKEDVK